MDQPDGVDRFESSGNIEQHLACVFRREGRHIF
jgi:hypothetical protein